MAIVRVLVWLVGAATMLAAGVTADAGNPDWFQPATVRLSLAVAGSLVAVAAIFVGVRRPAAGSPGYSNGRDVPTAK